jgi:hypothetical protein
MTDRNKHFIKIDSKLKEWKKRNEIVEKPWR